ncbi:MAG: type VI secretion system contractile sheath large subunit [Desulfobacterales bacterium]|jgi:type VI secretion system protein ImpC|nr:type VI secretion system contractile sheath large subunit [Desulfobacterales bacterium]
MTETISFGELDFRLVSGMNENRGQRTPETPFQIAVLGDFSGRTQRGLMEIGASLAERKVLPVDRDNIDAMLARLKVQIFLPAADSADAPEMLSFTELDDFHPDRIYSKLALFQALQAARKKADDPKAFAESLGKLAAKNKSVQPEPPPPPKVSSTSDFLDQVLDATGHAPEERKTAPRLETQWDRFLQKLVAPHTQPDTTVLRTDLKAKLDTAAGDMMRALLHYPAFQQLEAIWRTLAFLVSRVETDETLRICLIDVSKEEIAADVRSAENLRNTGIYKLLVEKSVLTPGAYPWSLLLGMYSFGPNASDLETLGRMAKIAHHSGAPFLSGADVRLLGCPSLFQLPDPSAWPGLPPEADAAWSRLRRLPEACWLGLALPRFLLRLPYGANTDPTERFDFEEMPEKPCHDEYLWGNPAVVCAFLLANAFSRDKWQLRPGTFQDVERLALHITTKAGETITQPCAEVLLTERTALKILDTGLMPLVSFKDQDMARLVRFQSIAQPATQLAGPWQEA